MKNIAGVISVAFFLLSSICSGAEGTPPAVPVKTIKTEDGDIFDCVDMYKQPTLNHPLLKDHKILGAGNERSADLLESKLTLGNYYGQTKPVGVTDLADKEENSSHVELEDAKCPPGTVPIHRVQKTEPADDKRTLGDSNDLYRMWARTEGKNRHYYGASARLNVYSVENVKPWQESSAMIGVKNGDAPMEIQGEVRAGWKVAPAIFGDDKTRLFIEWSANGGRTSCVNHLCPGFVQTNPKIYLGSRIWPVSTYKKDQYYIYLHIYKDKENNWWVAFRDLGNKIGYWPRELFKEFGYASTPYFGGLVSCKHGEECPAMGNGDRPLLFRWGDHACRVERVQVIGPDYQWGGLGMNKRNIFETEEVCYCVGEYTRDVHAYKFTFGGPPCNKIK